MHDEFERAYTGRRPARLSGMGWTLAGFVLVVLVGITAIGFRVNRAVHRSRDLAERFDGHAHRAERAQRAAAGELAELRALSELAELKQLDGALADLDEQLQLVSMDPDRGLDFVRGLEGDDPAGTLVARALPRPEDGSAHLEIRRSDAGGSLTIHSEDGSVRFDLVKGEDGTRLMIQSGDEVVRLGMAGEAQPVPDWVPRFGGMPEEPRPVYSLESPDGLLGAVAWTGDASAADVLSFYRSELEAQGYDIRAEARAAEDGVEEGAFWARSEPEGRVVFVVAHQGHDGTKVLLGFGEER